MNDLILTTKKFVLFFVEINGHQPRVFFTLNKLIRGFFSDVVHHHDDFAPRGIFHKSKVKKPYILWVD